MMDFLHRLAPAHQSDATRAVAVLPSRFASESPLRASIAQDRPAEKAGDDEAAFAFALEAISAPAANSALAAPPRTVAADRPLQTAMQPPDSGPTQRDFVKAAALTAALAEAPQIDATQPPAFETQHGAKSEPARSTSPKLQRSVAALARSQDRENATSPTVQARVTLPLSESILAQRAHQSRDDKQVVHVTIGRIDVVAHPTPAPAVRHTPTPRQATVTLADYLRGDKGSRQ